MLRLLNARVAEHQLDDADVDAIGQQPARAFVPEIVPAEIDSLELLPIPRRTFPRRSRLDAVSQQYKRFPRRADRALVFAGGSTERVRFRTEESAPLQELRKPALRLEGKAT